MLIALITSLQRTPTLEHVGTRLPSGPQRLFPIFSTLVDQHRSPGRPLKTVPHVEMSSPHSCVSRSANAASGPAPPPAHVGASFARHQYANTRRCTERQHHPQSNGDIVTSVFLPFPPPQCCPPSPWPLCPSLRRASDSHLSPGPSPCFFISLPNRTDYFSADPLYYDNLAKTPCFRASPSFYPYRFPAVDA